MYFTESLGEGQITLTDPADLPQDLAECPGQDGGQNKADQDHAQPVETGGDDGGRPSGKGPPHWGRAIRSTRRFVRTGRRCPYRS